MIEEQMTAAPASDAAPAPAGDAAAAPRRRRTVRAKSETASEQAEASAAPSDEAAAPAPHRRGRPRKAAAEEPATEEKPAAKRRGRPRKNAEDAPAESATASAPAVEQPASAAPADEAASPAPRRRGRPRKVAVEDEAASASGDATGEGSAKPARKNDAEKKGGHDRAQRHDNQKQRFQRNDNQGHRHQRPRRGSGQREMQPSVNKEELAKLKVADLRAKAAELGVDAAGLKKAELVDAVYEASVKAEGFIEVSGILDILADGYGFLRTQGYLPSENDCYVGLSTIRRNGLRKGDLICGQTRPARENEKYAAIQKIISVNGTPVEELGARVKFADLTPIYPDECLRMEHGKSAVTARVIDLVSPIGKGQRGLIVSPPKAGKTTILKDIATAITANNPEVHLMCLLVDERPEEVTDMQRSIKGEVISSTFDMPTENHIAVSELVDRAREAPGGMRQGRRHPAGLASRAWRARTTSRSPPRAASSPAASTPRRCTRPSASWAPPATSRTAAASPSWRRRSSTPDPRWTRSSSRSSRARATWSSSSTATWPTAASSRRSIRWRRARARRICCSIRSRRR